jgi:dolichol-phosphate mannosyltransferase
MPPRALVIIPAYNEAATIADVVTAAVGYAPVLVVNDGSRDRTGEIAAAIPGCEVINHQTNTHIPGAILDGFRFALAKGYDYAITMDAGLSHDPHAIGDLVAQPASDLVITYRPGATNAPLYRRLLSKTATFLVNTAIRQPRWKFWRRGYRDVTSGYRRYSRRAMESVVAAPMVCRSFDFHFEAVVVVSHAGLSITEFPIRYAYSNSSLNSRVVRQAFGTWLQVMAGLHRTKSR